MKNLTLLGFAWFVGILISIIQDYSLFEGFVIAVLSFFILNFKSYDKK